MTPLDTALQAAYSNPSQQNNFYNVFLNSEVFVPIHETSVQEPGKTRTNQQETFNPILVSSQDKAYLPVFDTLERLQAWAKREVKFLSLPAYALIEGLEGNAHLILNLGTEHVKEFFLDEIRWLKDLIAQHRPQSIQYEGGTQFKILVPDSLPEALREPLVQSFKKSSEVSSAYLVQVANAKHPEENPRWLLVIKMAQGSEHVFNAVAEAAAFALQGSLGPTEFLDILPYAGEDLDEAVVQQAQPFYLASISKEG